MAVLAGIRWLLVAMGVVSLAHTPHATAQTAAPSLENSVKAVFLFNFSKYVTWPATGGISERSPAEIRVCVTANDGFFDVLRAAIQGEDVGGRPLMAVALDGLDAARRCQILYVGDTRTPDARAWLNAVRGHQVLTVGDGALANGVVIAFVRDDNRLRFDINRAAGADHKLNISSKLLRLARQVRSR